jgi:hypothetical protein
MKNLKIGVLLFGIIGVVGAFLPLVSAGDAGSVSLWDLKEVDAGQVYLTMGSFVVAIVMGAMAMAQGMKRWIGIVATIAFALAVVKNREGMDAALGGKLMLIAAALGLVVSLITIFKPEKA